MPWHACDEGENGKGQMSTAQIHTGITLQPNDPPGARPSWINLSG